MQPRAIGARARAWPGRCGGWARASVTVALLVLLLSVSGCQAPPTPTRIPAPSATPMSSLPQGGSAGIAYLIAAPPFKKGEPPAYRDLYAVRLSNGRMLWRQRFGPQDGVFPLADERVLYLGSGSEQPGGQGRIAALRASDGQVIWRSALQAGAVVPLVASGNAVFVEALSPATDAVPPYQPDAIEALRASDGALLWKVPETSGAWATLGNGVLYLTPIIQGATPSQTTYLLVALDTSTGKLLWQITLPRPQSYYQAAVLSNGVLFMTPQQTTLHGSTPATALLAVRASNGQVLWQATTPGLARGSPVVVADGAVCYLADAPFSPASGIVALHTQDGSLSWQFFSQSSQPFLLLPSGGVLYALSETLQTTSYQERLDAYAMSDGSHLSRIPLPSSDGLGLMQVADGVFYGVVDTPNATAALVISLKASDGSLNWRYQIAGEHVQSLLVAP